jgi:phosphohistidine phosphatase
LGIDGLYETKPAVARLYILQHGDAIHKRENPDRPLSSDGQYDIQRLAGRMAEGSIGGDMDIGYILHSGKLRAEQTAQIISEESGFNVSVEKTSGINAKDNAADFIEDQNLNKNMDVGNGMIVSHMPFVSNLCSILLTGSADVEFDFKPGTLVCLFYEYEEWSMEYMIRPEVY